MPPVSDKMLGIEASRGIAASAVVCVIQHAISTTYMACRSSWHRFSLVTPASTFFVISGSIILYVHYFDIDQPSRISHYASRRFPG